MKSNLVGATPFPVLLLASAVLLPLVTATAAGGADPERDDGMPTTDGLGMGMPGMLPWGWRARGMGGGGFGGGDHFGGGGSYPIPPALKVRDCVAKAIKKCVPGQQQHHHHKQDTESQPQPEAKMNAHETAINHQHEGVGSMRMDTVYFVQPPMPWPDRMIPVDPTDPSGGY